MKKLPNSVEKRFTQINDELPVIWHQLLLTFCKQYGATLDEMVKSSLMEVIKKHHHKIISPEIMKELS